LFLPQFLSENRFTVFEMIALIFLISKKIKEKNNARQQNPVDGKRITEYKKVSST